ncbi:unnamed protein product [Rotaria socialis]|uniref:HTH psq-type domain-containing protein n=1 Tax=Rotaria socialis TaxID=392032 RepID=A0A818B455_9BILA|nr:unnamed protein product [Rotaria socialis]
MVRTYKRKTDGPTYSEEDLKHAVKHIEVEKWSYRKSSAHFKIPLGALSSHILKLRNTNIGHPTALACEEERYLVDLKAMEDRIKKLCLVVLWKMYVLKALHQILLMNGLRFYMLF